MSRVFEHDKVVQWARFKAAKRAMETMSSKFKRKFQVVMDNEKCKLKKRR